MLPLPFCWPSLTGGCGLGGTESVGWEGWTGGCGLGLGVVELFEQDTTKGATSDVLATVAIKIPNHFFLFIFPAINIIIY